MQTTRLRDAETDSRTSARRRGRLRATLLTAGALSVAGVLAVTAQLTSDPPWARSATSQVVTGTAVTATPPAARFENDFLLCALGADGIEATYTGALVAQTVSRSSATCAPAGPDAPFPAPND